MEATYIFFKQREASGKTSQSVCTNLGDPNSSLYPSWKEATAIAIQKGILSEPGEYFVMREGAGAFVTVEEVPPVAPRLVVV